MDIGQSTVGGNMVLYTVHSVHSVRAQKSSVSALMHRGNFFVCQNKSYRFIYSICTVCVKKDSISVKVQLCKSNAVQRSEHFSINNALDSEYEKASVKASTVIQMKSARKKTLQPRYLTSRLLFLNLKNNNS